jgi:predicted nucleic acid-binding protein
VAGDVRAVLDTSVVLASDVPPLEGDLSVSTATLPELHFGALTTGLADVRAERLRRLALGERLFDPSPIDEEVARSYGRLAAAVASAGRRPRSRVMDVLIAATAYA